MIYIFYTTFIIGVIVFFFKRKRFDFLSATFVGMAVYFCPGFVGAVINPYVVADFPTEMIHPETYLAWILAMATAIVAGLYYNPEEPADVFEINTSIAFDISLMLLMAVSFLATLIIGGDDLFSPDKTDVLNVQGRVFIFYSTISQISCVSFVIQRKLVGSVISLLSVMFFVYIGYRLELAVSAIAIMTVLAMQYGLKSFRRPTVFMPSAAAILLAFTYKSISAAVRAGRYDIVTNTLYGGNFLTEAFLKAEPFGTQAILNEVIFRGFSIPASGIIYSLLAFVPLANVVFSLGEHDIDFVFQDYLFPNLDYGLASNIYAHFYSALGWPGIAIFVALHVSIVIMICRYLASDRKRPYIKLTFVMIGSFLAFYIHRNNLGYSINLIDRYVYVTAITWTFSRFIAAFSSTPDYRPSRAIISRRGLGD